MLCQKGPDLSDVVYCKPARSSSLRNVLFEGQLVIKDYTKISEVDGVIVDEPNWIVKSCCRVGVAGKTRSSVFPRLSCRWCSFIHAEMSARQPDIRAATNRSSGWKEIELCVISIEMVGKAMCLYDGTTWCSVCGEEERSKNRSLGNPSDQMMCFGYLPSPGHLERPSSEIREDSNQRSGIPVMSSDERVDRRIWWLTVSKAADRSSRMRTDDLESAFAIHRASVTESSAVSVEWPLLKPDCLASSLLFCERNNGTWMKTTRSSVLAMNGRRETGL